MPSRKSDQRKSDVTTARFAPVDDLPEDQVILASAPSEAPPSATPAQLPQDETLSPSPAADKKDKDKDKDVKDAVTIEDLTLPKSIITRLAKGVLPPNTQIQANAILAISKSATVFINYLAAHANENTINANKKTISQTDVFKALDEIEMPFLREPLEAEFAKFSAMQAEKRTSYRQKVRSKGPTSNDDTDMADTTLNDTTTATFQPTDESPAPRAKKARVDESAADAEVDDAETEDDDVEDDDDDDADDDVEEEEEEQVGGGSGDETQDALEERGGREERDEALDGDESD